MHIIHLYDGHEAVHEGRGSVPNVVWNVAKATADRGHDVTILERRWRGLEPSTSHDRVAFERIDLRTGAREPWQRVPYDEVTTAVGLARLVVDRSNFAIQALRRLRGREFDVLHVHLPFAADVMATLVPSLRQRLVYTAHLGELRLGFLSPDDDDVAQQPHAPRFLSWLSPDVFLAARARKTTVLNDRIRESFEARGIEGDRLAVIPNGVDLSRFGEVEEAALDEVRERYAPSAELVVLFVGTFMPRKGVLELVEALEQTPNGLPDGTRVILAGENDLDEEYTATVERSLRRHDLDELVTMPGFVPAGDLPALYAMADLCVLPSLEEGFGMTAIEAMAAGTPVLATRVGALADLVDPGVDGELVDAGDTTGLATALESLLRTPEELEAMGARARERAAAYTWGEIAERFVEVYEEVAA